MIQAGRYNTLKVVKKVDFGLYLDGGDGEEILLPKRFVPRGAKDGDELEVFLYHDSENRIIATTQRPYGIVDDIVMLKCVGATKQGAFLDWGLMKDLFVPLSQQESRMQEGGKYLVKIFIDEQTGRIAATERIARFLSNDDLTLNERDAIEFLVYRETDIGYEVIINNQHIGLLHYNEVFRELEIGDRERGFVKTIREDNKIDVSIGERGYAKVEDEGDKILRLLQENDGYLPYHDKSDPEEIYEFFGISKKTFKMTVGTLYKQKKIELTQSGIKLIEE
ncbi:MAG: RNA-binding protein [Sphingobacteriales bacterium]|nr:MAG: RNA-binding protein [Sphingobacteriales bacterium]